jgi:hypothetical protein
MKKTIFKIQSTGSKHIWLFREGVYDEMVGLQGLLHPLSDNVFMITHNYLKIQQHLQEHHGCLFTEIQFKL